MKPCSKGWNPPMMMKPCIIGHPCSNNDLLRIIALDKNLTQSSNSLLAIFWVTKNCLMDQASMYSGTSSAQMNSGRWCSINDCSGFHTHLWIQPFTFHFFRQGILGWIVTQVQEKIVTRQPHIMFQIVLQCARSLQLFPTNEQFLMVGMGPASIEGPWSK